MDLTGKQFGRLFVVCKVSPNYYLCACSCGTEKRVLTSSLTRRQNASKSCGCIQRETASAIFQTHGESNPPTAEFVAWTNMKARCTDPNNTAYASYGGRGIKVCERWRSYVAFLEDMGRKPSTTHSLDRINNSGNYEPMNCRWATKSEQMLNRRSWTWSEKAKKDFKRRMCHRISSY